MGLEHRHHPLGAERPGGLQRCAHFGRVVGVVVEHARARSGGAARLEATTGSAEAGKGGCSLGKRNPSGLRGSERSNRVEYVVLSGNMELNRRVADAEARTAGHELDVGRKWL